MGDRPAVAGTPGGDRVGSGGDEAVFYGAMAPVSMGSNREQLRTITKVVAPDAHLLRREAEALGSRKGIDLSEQSA